MLIAKGTFTRQTLAGKTAIVTGAGGGIGYEAARALAWLGARVVIVEIDAPRCEAAAQALNRELGAGGISFLQTDAGDEQPPSTSSEAWTGPASFVQTDVGDELSVQRLAQAAGPVDIVLNNATLAPLGLVKDVAIADWDCSYWVNLRGPVLLARAFLPGMLARNAGVFGCVSSTGTAYMGAYETFKAAQVHLGNTLAAELEGSGVAAFTIGPGLVPTATAQAAVERLAPQMGLSLEAFYQLNAGALLTVEEAGAGFAAAVVLAEQFRGQEISSMQALKAAGLPVAGSDDQPPAAPHKPGEQALALCRQVRATLAEQTDGWKHRSLFERQWVIRDFRKTAGMPAEEWLSRLEQLETGLTGGDSATLRLPFDKLAGYYGHLADLAKGYERNPAKLEENLRHVYGWQDEVKQLAAALN